MGKKKIAEKITEEDSREEKATSTPAEVKSASQPTGGQAKKIQTGCVYISASYNNTMVTVTDEKGNVLAWASSGALGFSGPKKATPFAASKIVGALTEKLK